MTLKQEIAKAIKDRGPSIVDERIVPETWDNISEWTTEIMRKLTKLDGEEQAEVGEVYSQIHMALTIETIKQLSKIKH